MTKSKKFLLILPELIMSNQLLRKSPVITAQLREDIPEFKAGNVVEVHYKIQEGNKERIQIFKGIVIARKGGSKSMDATFTVLKNSTSAIKVERTFPLHSPMIEKIVVASNLKRAKQSKLYHLREVKDPEKSVKTKPLKIKS